MQQFALLGEGWYVGKIVNDDQDVEELPVVLLLLELYDFVLGLDDVLQRFGVVVVEVDGRLLGVPHLHLLLDIQLHGVPGGVHVNTRAEDVDPGEAVAVDVQDHVLEQDSLPTTRRSKDYGPERDLRDNGIFTLLCFVFLQLDRLDHWGSDAIIICHPSIIYK